MLFLNEAEPKALILCGCLVIQLCITGRLHSVLGYRVIRKLFTYSLAPALLVWRL